MKRAFLFACAVSLAVSAAEPDAELEPGSPGADVSVGKGAAQQHQRVAAGRSLGLKVAGPATVRLDLRVEGAGPAKPATAVVELDGKPASKTAVQAAVEEGAKSNRDLAVSKATPLEVKVPAGIHAVALRWAADASGDALVAVHGVKLVPAGSLAAALPLPGDLALPAGKKVADALPLPGASPLALPEAPAKPPRKKDAAAALPLPGAALALPGAAPEPKREVPGLSLPAAAKPAPEPVKPAVAKAEPPKAEPAKAAPAKVEESKTAKAAPLANAPAGVPAPTRTILAQNAGAAAPPAAAGAPKAMSNAVVPAGDLSLRATETSPWSVRALAGAERSNEQGYTDAVSTSHLALEGSRAFAGLWLARAQLDFRTSRQSYVLDHVTPTAQKGVLVDETRIDFTAGAGYDVGARLVRSGRLELTPMLGVQYMAIRNGAFPQDLIGPNLSGRARFALSSAVILQATAGYTYNLSVQSAANEHSALKAPVGDFAMRGGIALPLAGDYALELDYSGDILGFQNTYRVAHGAALGFGTSF